MRTPIEIDKNVQNLICNFSTDSQPIFLDVTPEPWAKELECFPNVAEKIDRDGGDLVTGWQIWDCGFFVEAEFHGIWRSKHGELKDITPKQLATISRILFLADSATAYTGCQRDNVRKNSTDNKLVDDFITTQETLFKIMNHGEYAFQKEVQLNPDESRAYRYLHGFARNLVHMIKNGLSVSSPCPCQSKIKYKRCHRVEWSKSIDEITKKVG